MPHRASKGRTLPGAVGSGVKAFPILMLLALSLASAVSAQSGRSGMSSSAPLTNVRAYSELRAFGECFARYQRRSALAVIATVPGSVDEDKALHEQFYGEHDTCAFGGTQMTMSSVFARGVIAEGLLRAKGVPDEYRLSAPAPGEAQDLHGVARCYAHGHPAEVQALLETQPGGPQELKAVGALWQDFRVCMPGFNVRLNAPWIRFLLAEAILRLGPDTPRKGG